MARLTEHICDVCDVCDVCDGCTPSCRVIDCIVAAHESRDVCDIDAGLQWDKVVIHEISERNVVSVAFAIPPIFD
jgi:hypothetical protein